MFPFMLFVDFDFETFILFVCWFGVDWIGLVCLFCVFVGLFVLCVCWFVCLFVCLLVGWLVGWLVGFGLVCFVLFCFVLLVGLIVFGLVFFVCLCVLFFVCEGPGRRLEEDKGSGLRRLRDQELLNGGAS